MPLPVAHREGTYGDLTMKLKYTSSEFKELKTPFGHTLWHRYACEGFSRQSAKDLINGHSLSSRLSMSAPAKQWYMFCQPRKINPLCPDYREVIDFLTNHKHLRLPLRTTLNWILESGVAHKVSISREVSKMCSSCKYMPPKLPRLKREHIWDPEMILDLYRSELDNSELSFMY